MKAGRARFAGRVWGAALLVAAAYAPTRSVDAQAAVSGEPAAPVPSPPAAQTPAATASAVAAPVESAPAGTTAATDAPAASAAPGAVAQPAAAADAPAASAEPGAAAQAAESTQAPASARAPAPRARRRWSAADVARIRAELAAQRAAKAAARKRRKPRVYGDAGAANMLGFELLGSFRRDVGYEHFERGATSVRLGVFGSRDVLTLAPKLIASLELGVGFEHDSAKRLFDASSGAKLDSQTLHGGLTLRWDALSCVSPLLRAWGGASLFQLTFSGSARDFETERTSSRFGALGAGFLFHTPARTFESRGGRFSSFGLGVLIEAGYAWRSPVDFEISGAEGRAIRVIGPSLGGLALSGPYLRSAFVVRM